MPRAGGPRHPTANDPAAAPMAACASILALAFAGLLVVAPVVAGLARALREPVPGDAAPSPTPASSPARDQWIPDASLLASTLLWCAGIAGLATLLAIPLARHLRRVGFARGAWVLTPLVLPNYLAYSGYGLLRAPGTWLGDAIEQGASGGADWLPLLAGRIIALVGLALWGAPLAALAMAASWRAVDESMLDAIRLDAPTRLARLRALARPLAPGFLAGVGVVALAMLGSAVPLHLAQVPTYAIRVWFELVQGGGAGAAWRAAWPIVVVGIIAAWALGGRVASWMDGAWATPEAPRPGARGGALAIIALAALVPLVLHARAIASAGSFPRVLRANADAFAQSAIVALIAGAIIGAIALATWIGASGGRAHRAAVALASRLLIAGAILPGVLIGDGVLNLSLWLPASMQDWLAWTAFAHAARFGFVASIVGLALARTQARDAAETKAVDGVRTLPAWLAASGPAAWSWIGAAIAATWVLSLHEIESTIIVQPPGPGAIAHKFLGYLHLWRQEEMSVGAVILAGACLALAVFAWFLAGRGEACPTRTRRGS